MDMTMTTRQQPISRLFARETREAIAEITSGGEGWLVALDGPKLGPMLLIYRRPAGGDWQTWGTAVWLDERIQHRTARNVDEKITEALGAALRAKLAGRAR